MAEDQWLPPRRYCLPLRQPVGTARGTHHAIAGTLHGLAAGMHVSWGDAPDVPGRPHLQPVIAAFAQDMARHAVAARHAGIALPAWLHQGYPDSTVPPVSELAVQALLALPVSASDLALIHQAGIACVKVKMTSAEPHVVRALVRDLTGQGLRVRLDVNGAWAGQSPDRLAELLAASAGAEYVEDPVPLSQWLPPSTVAVAADVLDSDPADILAAVRAGCVQVVVAKPALFGSIAAFLAFAREVADTPADLVVSSLLDGPVGLAALAALAAVTPGRLRTAGLASHLGSPQHLWPAALQVGNGVLRLASLWPADRDPPVLPAFDRLHGRAQQQPADIALIDADSQKTWSWAQFDDDVDAWAALLSARGVRPGARVAAWCDNAPAVPLAMWATWRLGGVWVPLHPRSTAMEISGLLARVRPAAVLVDAGHAWPDGLDIRSFAPDAALPAAQLPLHAADSADDAVLLFTSGTTGVAKAARLSHGALEAAASASVAALGVQSSDRWLCCLPLCHVAGLSIAVRAAVQGVPMVLLGRPEPTRVLAALQDHRCTLASLVPAALVRVLAIAPDTRAPPSLRALLLGGGPIAADLLARAHACGWPALPTYGLTESCAQVATARPNRPGLHPLAGVELRLDAVDPDGVGEILVRTAQCMTGYLDDPAASAATLAGGWLHTGDLGRLGPDGLEVLARRTDLILRGGENIYPAAIEGVLAAVPGVREVAVVGLPDAAWGQIVAAWVVGPPDIAADLDAALLALAPFKRPTRLWLTQTPLPRVGIGKVARREVAAFLTSGMQVDDEWSQG